MSLDAKWFGVDVTWNDPIVRGVTGAVSGHENEQYLLVGSDTEIRGMRFAASHPATNQAAAGGVAFNNGPTLSPVAFAALTAYAPLTAEALPFTDVKAGDWFYDAVRFVYDKRLMGGTSDTTFDPEKTMSRAMIVTVLYRMEGDPEVTAAAVFADVEPDQWYTDAVVWATANGIVGGYSPTEFGPKDRITREQLSAILYRYAQGKGVDVSTGEVPAFTDGAEASAYAAEAVRWAASAGMLDVKDGALRPGAPATRAEVAKALMMYGKLS